MAELRTKMASLAKRVKPTISSYEELRLEMAVKDSANPSREIIQKSIANILNESVDTVRTKLGEHSDSDRIIEEIIMHLDSATGKN